MVKDLPPAPVDDPGSAQSVDELEERGRSRLSEMAIDYVAGGAADELTVGWNRRAYDGIRLRSRIPESAEPVDLSVPLLGRTLPHPILLAPTAYHRVVHEEGERATARGAAAADATWVVSTGTTTSIEEIAAVAGAPLWFQLYLQSDPGVNRDLVRRVEEAGVEALVLTVDTPAIGVRYRQTRSAFGLPEGVSTPHLDDLLRGRRTILTPERVPVTWKEIEWLRGIARVPLLLKGILTAADARRAVAAGVGGIIVSNHGGRNLDTLPATIDALPEVAAASAGDVPLLVDGGIRRGTDVVKALARGADAVLIGRPYLWGLAAHGAAGVERAVRLLVRETELALTLCGHRSARAVGPEVLWDG